MEECKIKNLYNLDETIAKELLGKFEYPWEVLPEINDFILEIGPKLDPEVYELKGENIWIAKSANVYPSAYIKGPAIIGESIKRILNLIPREKNITIETIKNSKENLNDFIEDAKWIQQLGN